MKPSKVLRSSLGLLLTLLTINAAAGPKDGAASTKIDEAINTHYLATDFAKAEAVLLGVVKACGTNGCSPAVVAKAWMYVGLVRGSGKQNLPGAAEAFKTAKAADPGVQLDTALATPEVKAEFDKVAGGGGATAVAPTPGAAAVAPAAEGDVQCSPAAGYEVETRRAIPVSCSAVPGATKGVLSYHELGGSGFKTVPIKLEQGTLRTVIPCSATQMQGALPFFITLQDAKGTTVAEFGNQAVPEQFTLVPTTANAPPAFPGAAPPARCAEEVECPPGMPGCERKGGGGWGDSCTPASPCKSGLFCDNGTCGNAPSCEIDADCDSGKCSKGFCDMGDGAADGESGESGGKMRKLRLGIHFGADIGFMPSVDDACSDTNLANGNYTCYNSGSTSSPLLDRVRAGNANAGKVSSGASLATMRVLASADYAIKPVLTLGVRLGYAFGGGPDYVKYTADPGGNNNLLAATSTHKKFLPLHAEGRAVYWFKSLAQPGLHPYFGLTGGLAQVDVKLKTQIRRPGDNAVVNVDVYRKAGQGFAGATTGIYYPIGARGGLQLNINVMYMLPTTAIILEPSLGYLIAL